MKAEIEKILKSPSQDLFVYDKTSKHWYCRENSDYLCPEVSIDQYTKLVVQSVLDLLEQCKIDNPVDGKLNYDYYAFQSLVNERFYANRKPTDSKADQGLLFHWV